MWSAQSTSARRVMKFVLNGLILFGCLSSIGLVNSIEKNHVGGNGAPPCKGIPKESVSGCTLAGEDCETPVILYESEYTPRLNALSGKTISCYTYKNQRCTGAGGGPEPSPDSCTNAQ